MTRAQVETESCARRSHGYTTPNLQGRGSPVLRFQKESNQSRLTLGSVQGSSSSQGFPGLAATEEYRSLFGNPPQDSVSRTIEQFTVLNVPIIRRAWIEDLAKGRDVMDNAPLPWAQLINRGSYMPLMAQPTRTIRSVEQQAPKTPLKSAILRFAWEYFEQELPTAFEAFAARVYALHGQARDHRRSHSRSRRRRSRRDRPISPRVRRRPDLRRVFTRS